MEDDTYVKSITKQKRSDCKRPDCDGSVCCSIDRLLYDWRRVLCDYAYTYFLLFNWSRPGMCLGGFIASVLADITAGTKKYRSKVMNIFAYIIYSFGPTGTYLAYFVNPEAWAETMLKNGTTQEYINTMNDTASVTVLIIMIVGTILVAGLSGLVGSKLLKKQFEKAGITA